MNGTMSDRFNVSFVEATPSTITLKFTIKEIKIDRNSSMIVNIYKSD